MPPPKYAAKPFLRCGETIQRKPLSDGLTWPFSTMEKTGGIWRHWELEPPEKTTCVLQPGRKKQEAGGIQPPETISSGAAVAKQQCRCWQRSSKSPMRKI